MDFLNNWTLTVAEIFLCAMVEGPLANPYFDLNSLAATSSAYQKNESRKKFEYPMVTQGGV